jgi:hypothetical protein
VGAPIKHHEYDPQTANLCYGDKKPILDQRSPQLSAPLPAEAWRIFQPGPMTFSSALNADNAHIKCCGWVIQNSLCSAARKTNRYGMQDTVLHAYKYTLRVTDKLECGHWHIKATFLPTEAQPKARSVANVRLATPPLAFILDFSSSTHSTFVRSLYLSLALSSCRSLQTVHFLRHASQVSRRPRPCRSDCNFGRWKPRCAKRQMPDHRRQRTLQEGEQLCARSVLSKDCHLSFSSFQRLLPA